MNTHEFLAVQFESHRPHLRAVAYRMLGSLTEAEDAVQEAWLRLARTDTDGIDNLAGWLTTVTSRVCLNVLQSRRAHPEVPLDAQPEAAGGPDPEDELLLADSIGLALLTFTATNRLFDQGGFGVLVWLALLGLATYGLYWVWTQYRRYAI